MKATVQLFERGSGAVGLTKALLSLTSMDVLVGYPRKTAGRQEGTVTNAMLGYIHDNGSPLAGIPPRPHLREGIKDDKVAIAAGMKQAGQFALQGKPEQVERALNAVGLEAQKAVRRKITIGPFAPLKAATIRGRLRRHKGRKNTSVVPLVDTGQMRQAVNYILRKKPL